MIKQEQCVSIRESGQSGKGQPRNDWSNTGESGRRGAGIFASQHIAYFGRMFLLLLIAGMLSVLYGTQAQALTLKEESDRPSSYELLFINEDTFLYEQEDETSAVLLELKKQQLVVPVEIGVPWVKVSIGDVTGYVKSQYVQMENPDPLAVQEFEEQEEYHVELINEIERLREEQKRSRIYGIIIICIIVGIFAAGIVSTIVARKQEENKKALKKRG